MKLYVNEECVVRVGIHLGRMLKLERKMNRHQVMKGLLKPGEILAFYAEKSK